MRGATFPSRLHSSLFLFLLTHLMRGATFSRFIFIVLMSISTHAPHARCNLQYGIMITVRGHFYSRTSCEVQRLSLSFSNVTSNFYSRTSCEVQPLLRTTKKTTSYFYSRTSCEVQPCNRCHLGNRISISTHAPHARCNLINAGFTNESTSDFYSRTSCEVQPSKQDCERSLCIFLLTHLMRGATCLSCSFSASLRFLLTHLMRGATKFNNP